MAAPGYGIHVFVCEHERGDEDPRGCCAARNGKNVRLWFREAMLRRGILEDNRINRSGCLNYCKHGPVVVVYSALQLGGTWYHPKTQAEVERIVEEHFVAGEPVTDLQLDV